MAAEEHNITANVAKHFPGSLDRHAFVMVIQRVLDNIPSLEGRKYLLATSTCPDEINRDLDQALVRRFGRPFTMGGLAGIPFVGLTGFGAFAAHAPLNGCLIIISASHIGFNHHSGKMGSIVREGAHDATTSCGAGVGAYEFCKKHLDLLDKIAAGDKDAYAGFSNELDQQQNYVLQYVAAHYKEISSAPNPQVALSKVLAQKIEHYLDDIIVACPIPIVHINGIQINIEGAHDQFEDDYFCVHSFDLIIDGKKEELITNYTSERTHYLSHYMDKLAVLLNDA